MKYFFRLLMILLFVSSISLYADEAVTLSPKGRFLMSGWQGRDSSEKTTKTMRRQRYEEAMYFLYDQNKDGKFDDQELARMNHDLKKHGDDFVKKYDLNRDGKVDAKELETLQKEVLRKRSRFLQMFDKNDDGELDASEKMEARKEMEKRRAEFRAQFSTPVTDVNPVQPLP